MDHPELSLGPYSVNCSSPESEGRHGRRSKGKSVWEDPTVQGDIDLQLKHPLPADWEQCLDLQSGRMYYLNRKTLEKSWDRPRDQRIDLDLKISSTPADSYGRRPDSSSRRRGQQEPITGGVRGRESSNSSSSNMVAVSCLRCHLLVMLSRSYPLCPNCKYLHCLPSLQNQQQPQPGAVEGSSKSLETLTLLH